MVAQSKEAVAGQALLQDNDAKVQKTPKQSNP
jgi:hypothetical protein